MTNYEQVGDRAARYESPSGHDWIVFRRQVISEVVLPFLAAPVPDEVDLPAQVTSPAGQPSDYFASDIDMRADMLRMEGAHG